MFYVDIDKCNGCGDCVDVCSQEAISIRDGKAAIDPRRCIECGMCFSVCAAGAIQEAVPQTAGMYRGLNANLEEREVSNMLARGSFGMGRGMGMGRGLGMGRGIGMGRGMGMGRGLGMGRY